MRSFPKNYVAELEASYFVHGHPRRERRGVELCVPALQLDQCGQRESDAVVGHGLHPAGLDPCKVIFVEFWSNFLNVKTILIRMLEGILDPTSGIRRQDGSSVFRFVAANPLGRYIAFNFLRNNWTEIKN